MWMSLVLRVGCAVIRGLALLRVKAPRREVDELPARCLSRDLYDQVGIVVCAQADTIVPASQHFTFNLPRRTLE